MDEAAWKSAPWTSDFVWIDAGDTAPLRSRAKVLYDREALHFALEFESPKAASRLGAEEPLDPDLLEACEIFLDAEGSGKRYFEYAVAPDGTEHSMVWNGRLSMRKWSPEPGLESRRGVTRAPLDATHDRMVYEISFPWRGMASLTNKMALPPKKGEAWRMNFSRVESGQFAGDYVWSPAGFYYMHQPNTFGWLVFAGAPDEKPLSSTDGIGLRPRADVSTSWQSKRFPLWSRIYWPRFPLLPVGNGDFYVVTKTAVSRVNGDGHVLWERTRKDGLPQFIRSIGIAEGRLWLAGNGIGQGVVSIDGQGEVLRKTELGREGQLPQILPVKSSQCLMAWPDGFRLVGRDVGPFITTKGRVLCAASPASNRIAAGTANGIDLYDGAGKLLLHKAITGGIVSLAVTGDSVIGVSGKNGLFRMSDQGVNYFPAPLRTPFHKIFADSQKRVWAAYTGGLAHIENGKVRWFDAPLGIEGIRIVDAVEYAPGCIVFAASVPAENWYASSRLSSFLLIYEKGKWRKITLDGDLPGQIVGFSKFSGDTFVLANSGIFRLWL